MMEYLQVVIQLLLAGLIAGLAAATVRAAGACKISFAASSPAGELAAPSHKTMSQTTWYQNRGPAKLISAGRSCKRCQLPSLNVQYDHSWNQNSRSST